MTRTLPWRSSRRKRNIWNIRDYIKGQKAVLKRLLVEAVVCIDTTLSAIISLHLSIEVILTHSTIKELDVSLAIVHLSIRSRKEA